MLGCRVDALDEAQAVARIVELAKGSIRSGRYVWDGDGRFASRNPGFRDLVNGAALSLCDTVGVALGRADARRSDRVDRVAGVD